MKPLLRIITALFIILIFANCEKSTAGKINPEKINNFSSVESGVAPNFVLSDLEGNLVNFYDEFHGKVILLNFWATWCPPCRTEMPDLVKLQEKYGKDGLVVVGISIDDLTKDQIKEFADNYSINFPILANINGQETYMVGNAFAKAAGIRFNGVPTTFLINREGRIVKSYIGARSEMFFYNDLKHSL